MKRFSPAGLVSGLPKESVCTKLQCCGSVLFPHPGLPGRGFMRFRRGFVCKEGWSDVHLTSLRLNHHHKFQSKEGKPLSKRQLLSLPLGSTSFPQGHRGQRSYEDFGEGVGSGTADVALGGVERHIVDRLVKLLPVSRELLNACLALHVPQTDGAVVT